MVLVYFPLGNFILHLGQRQIIFPKNLKQTYAINENMLICICFIINPITNESKIMPSINDMNAIIFTRELKLIFFINSPL